MVDGEILESLWAQLNDVSRSTRTSTLAHRSEVLDDHMNYSNWNKMVNIVSSVILKYNKSVVGLVDSQEYFEQLNGSALSSDVSRWTQDIRNAEKQQERGNLNAMDIMELAKPENYEGKFTICIAPPLASYGSCCSAGGSRRIQRHLPPSEVGTNTGGMHYRPLRGYVVQCLTEAWLNICLTVPKSTADVQLDLMEQESADTRDTGQTSWIATGLKIEESQSVVH